MQFWRGLQLNGILAILLSVYAKVTMPMFRTSWPRACLLALALAAGASHAQTPPQPAEQFFENPRFGGARFSPNGRLVAVRVGKPGRRDTLAVYDIASNKVTQVASYKNVDVGRFDWVNDKRLVFNTADKQIGQGDMRDGPGLYAVDADGSELRQLALRRGMPYVSDGTLGNRRILPANTFMLAQAGKQDSDSIYVSSPELESEGAVNLLRLDTRNGRSETVTRPRGARTWILDGRGEPRLVVATEADQAALYERGADQQWRKAASSPHYAKLGLPMTPIGFGPDGVLYVKANPKNDTSALYTFDLAAGKLSPEPLVSTPGYDFDGALITSAGKLLGVRFTTDAVGTHWFDPRMREVQAAVDAALPATVNQISLPARPETPWVLVEAFSDVQPRLTLLYNMETNQFNHIGTAHPDIKPAAMAQQSVVHYKARDGLDIPALLTLPPGRKASGLPLVVLVHGGPWVRGTHWGWDADTQFLASRGYAVLEPEFRGSTGYGSKHYRAGWKQWGLAMQDDIADGAKWAIAEGMADPARICIAGASYGGYATLMGLVNNPELFKCGIDYVGVTDITLLFEGHWSFQSDVSDDAKKYSMPLWIGDPKRDAAQFAATSPLVQAARITQPLLLAYGGADRRVPIYHGKKFRDTVMKTNKDVEWVEYESEGHGWALPETRIDFWTRVEKFLDRNIGPAAAINTGGAAH